MGDFRIKMRGKRKKFFRRFGCLIVVAMGIGFLFYGCGKGDSVKNTTVDDMAVADAAVWEAAEKTTVGQTDHETEALEENEEPVRPLLEQLFTYEKEGTSYNSYLTITGIAEEYKADFAEYMHEFRNGLGSLEKKYICFPADVDGIPVKEIGAYAFADMEIDEIELGDTIEMIAEGAFRNTGVTDLELPENLKLIGEAAFENCNLNRLEFSDQFLFIDKRAFAGNPDLWTVLMRNVDTQIKEEAFADCSENFLLCYGDDTEGKENLVAKYAKENGFDSMEIVLSKTPIVHYPSEPYVLQPRIDNFFYGDDGDEEKDQWCTWEADENAPNFGYSDWQWGGCSSWCGVIDFEQTAEATSELASANGRYSAENILVQNRDAAWAEGAEGYGIGESIIYRQSCTNLDDNKWKVIRPDDLEPVYDGFMRYTEICIVNGYAKDQKTWEENGRIKRLLMYVEDRPYAYLELEDTILPQYFSLPEGDIKVLNGGMIEVRFEIVEVYPGSVYEDTCLTGLVMEFSGRHAH